MLVTKVEITLSILLIILPIFYIFLFAFGFGLILSSLAVFFRDTIHFYGVVLVLWTYLTPLFYPLDALSEGTRKVVEMNPLTNIVEYMRMITLYGKVPSFELNILCLAPGVVCTFLGLIIFYKTQDKFILHL